MRCASESCINICDAKCNRIVSNAIKNQNQRKKKYIWPFDNNKTVNKENAGLDAAIDSQFTLVVMMLHYEIQIKNTNKSKIITKILTRFMDLSFEYQAHTHIQCIHGYIEQ